jgi:hypothetical protein
MEEQNKRNIFNSSGGLKKNALALKWILVISIVIVLNLFFNFAIKLVYDAPEFENFCEEKQVQVSPDTPEACVEVGGQWNDHGLKRAPAPERGIVAPTETGWCDVNFTCAQEFKDVNDIYQRNVFVVLVVLGVISILVGIFTSQISAVSLGLSLGGILSLVIGSMRYWSSMDDILRVIILGLALVALIWVGVRKIKD